jgi:D-tyrosyl-tRNA(Tyr) deacylase
LNTKFTKIELNSNYAIGHFVRKLDTEYLDLEMLNKAVRRSTPMAQVAILDWKGIKGEKRKEIIGLLTKLGIKVIKTKDALRGERVA